MSEKDLSKRVEELERLTTFLIVPSICNLLDEAMFNKGGELGINPLKRWINLKFHESDLSDEQRQYLVDFLEKFDFAYRPLRR